MHRILNFRRLGAFALVLAGALACVFTIAGCKKESDNSSSQPVSLYQRGQQVYMSRCIACHNTDPHKPGSIGPDLFGSSLELITARVMHAQYPPGYKPKRDSHIMPPLPSVEPDIPALHAFLNGIQDSKPTK